MADGLWGTRERAPRIDPVPIQPAGVNSSTFIRPNQVSTGTNAENLVRSLSGLNQALQGYANAKAVSDRDPNSEENQRFLDSIQGKDIATLQAMASSEEFGNRIQRDGLMTLLGSKANSDFRNSTQEWYANEFDQNEGNLAAELEKRRQDFAAQLPDDAARAAFFKGSEEWTQRFLSGDIERRNKVAASNRNEAVVDEFRTIADDAFAKGSSAAEVADQIIRQSGLNRSFRGLSGQEQNATLFSLAQEYALAGKPELVRAILENDRGGVGAVAKSSEFAVKSAQLIEAAETKQSQETTKTSFDLYTDIDRQVAEGTLTAEKMAEIAERNPFLKDMAPQTSAWVQQSENNRRTAAEKAQRDQQRVDMANEATRQEQAALAGATHKMTTLMGAQFIEDQEVATPTGGTRTYTRQQQIDDSVKLYLDQARRKRQERIDSGMTPEAADDADIRDKVNLFSGNGIANPEWERMFGSMAIVSSLTRLGEGGEIPKNLGTVAETYYKIAKLNPAFASSLVKDGKAGEFLEAYADARDDLTLSTTASPQDALVEAARLLNRSPEEKQAAFVPRKDVEKVVKSSMSEGWFSGPTIDSDFRTNPANLGIATDLVQGYMRRGMGQDRAIEKAKETLKERASYVNGVAIIPQGRVLPKDFSTAAEGYLDTFVKQRNPEASGADLYLSAPNDGTDNFVIMRKDGVVPVGTVSLKDLDKWRSDERATARQKEASWGRAVEKDGWAKATLKWGLSGFEVETSNMTPEQADKFLKDKQETEAVDAWVRRQAKNDGIRYDSLGGKWRKGGNLFGFGQTDVKPIVTWSRDEKSVRWVPAD